MKKLLYYIKYCKEQGIRNDSSGWFIGDSGLYMKDGIKKNNVKFLSIELSIEKH